MKSTTLASLAALLITTGSAHAAAVTVTFDDPIFRPISSQNYDTVRVKANGWHDVNAGLFIGTASNLVGVSPHIFVDGVNDVLMYCYDLFQSISPGQRVDYTIKFDDATARTLDFLGAVNYVLHGNSNTWTDPYAWLHPRSGLQGAAIQLGIWESLYETNGKWDIDQGGFEASGLEGTTQDEIAKFFNAIPAANSLDRRYTMVLRSQTAQDMITADPPASVPEPASVALLATALAGMGLARRRKS